MQPDIAEIARGRRERDVYIAILVAAARGKGLRLTADECAVLALDDAISTRASNGLEEGEFVGTEEGSYLHSGWAAVDPYAKREPWNGRMRPLGLAVRSHLLSKDKTDV